MIVGVHADMPARAVSGGVTLLCMTDPLVIALVSERDIIPITEIENWAIGHTAANFNEEPLSADEVLSEWTAAKSTHPWLVARRGDVVVGFARAHPHRGRCAYLYTVEASVYVHPDHQAEGAGRALYERLLPTLRAQGYHTVLAGIALPNEPSVGLHEALGFERAGTFTQVGYKFGLWHDVGYWQRYLDGPGGEPGGIKPVAEVWV